MSDPELLRAAITASGLSARRFAVEVLTRDERTVRRWLRGPVVNAETGVLERNELPKAVRDRCLQIIGRDGSDPS